MQLRSVLLLVAALCAMAAALPRVKHTAPGFVATAVHNEKFVELDLHKDYRGKWVVLVFYPLDFTFVCPTELIAFSDRIDEFHALNADVLGASVDSKYSHLQWIKLDRKAGGLGTMRIPLIADIEKKIARDYGVLIEEGADAGIALRGLFIIDPKGIVRQMTVNDLPVGRSVDETLRLLKAFQFADTHGEVCPADWVPGRPTIKDNPIECKNYFEAVNN